MTKFVQAFLTLLLLFFVSNVVTASPISPYQCGKTCSLNTDCGNGGFCNKSGLCEHRDFFCESNRWSVSKRGEIENCNQFICNATTGRCLREAQGPSDCTPGFVFETSSKSCVKSIQCDPSIPICQMMLTKWQNSRLEYETKTPQPTLMPFICKSCGSDTHCESGMMCYRGNCVQEGPRCGVQDNSQAFSFLQGKIESCGLYACHLPSGECLKDCLSTADCTQGSRCLDRKCR